MYCNTCGAKIDDGVTFCQSCGARLIQPQQQQFSQNQQPQQPFFPAMNTPAEENGNVADSPAPKKKNGKIKAILSTVITFCLIVGIRVAAPYVLKETSEEINRNAGSEASEVYEEIAVTYFGYVFGTQNADGFKDSLAFDMMAFTEDMVEFMSKQSDCSAEEYYAYFSNVNGADIHDADSLIDYDYNYIYQQFEELIQKEFGSSMTEFAVKNSKKLKITDLQEVYEEMNEPMVQAGLDIAMYLDESLITEAYKITVNCVFDEKVKSDEYLSYENVYIYVLNYDGEYKVLYDEIMLDMMFETWLVDES